MSPARLRSPDAAPLPAPAPYPVRVGAWTPGSNDARRLLALAGWMALHQQS